MMTGQFNENMFAVPEYDLPLLEAIADRAWKIDREYNSGRARKRQDWQMDIQCVHARTPLRLASLLKADRFNFTHDLFGIARHLDRETGQLKDCFVPRFTARTK